MSHQYPTAMRRLINELSKLPSIGERSATRLAYHLLTNGRQNAELLSISIAEALRQVHLCRICYFLCEEDICAICRDESRGRDQMCVVEKPADVLVIERSGGFRGLYHVLHGVWSPLRGIRPEDTKIAALLKRLREPEEGDPIANPIKELILATGTTVDGEATSLYIASELDGLPLAITRIAQGLPRGGELEFADEMTLVMSLQGRRPL